MSMSFKDFLAQASDEELVKVACALSQSYNNNTAKTIAEYIEKIAEEVTEQVTQNISSLVQEQQDSEISKMKMQGNVNDMALPESKQTINRNDLHAALEEAILNGDPKALSQVISGVLQVAGEGAAENAISLARTILQDNLVSGKITKESLPIFAEAFSVMEQ